jgi:cytochrome c oxidase assembly protein subunit 11
MKLNRSQLPALAGAFAILAVMTTLVINAPALYRLFCGATGAAGTTQRATAARAANLDVAKNTAITVFFDSTVAPGLDWDFRPVRHSVIVHPGVPTKIYFEATNRSDVPVIAHATYNVTPYQVAPYFFKIQCFCFTDERLGPHESAKMPVLFYVDEHILKDPDVHSVRQITLSYTFFKQNNIGKDEAVSARDLKGGSAKLDASLANQGATTGVAFDNDAPRR